MPAISGHPDAMSDVLSLVRMRREVLCSVDFTGPWAFGYEQGEAHFHIVDAGSGWLTADPVSPPIWLGAGDLIFLPHGAAHALKSELPLQATPILAAIAAAPSQGFSHELGGGGEQSMRVLSGRLSFEGPLAPKVLEVLPPLIHHGNGQPTDASWPLLIAAYLRDEMTMSSAGWSIMIARLIDLLFIRTLRDWSAQSANNLGWLSGLVDPMIGKALSAIHEQPSRAWTVEALAAVAGLSRSAFAARFSDVVGQTPLRYLAQWRLDLAANHLRAGGDKIGEIAAQVGYGSDAALTRAFKAQFGVTPGAYRRSGG